MKTPLLALLALLGSALTSHGLVYTLNDFTIIDDGEGPNFSLSGFPGTDINAHTTGGFNNTRRWGNSGAGTTATWTFGTGASGDPLLAAGPYDVFVSWLSTAQANLNEAHYTGTDGFSPLTVDQEPGSLSYAGTLGVETFYVPSPPVYAAGTATFVRLGTVTVSDGSFALTVVDGTDDGTDYIFADAAALRPIPEPALLTLGSGLLTIAWITTRRRLRS